MLLEYPPLVHAYAQRVDHVGGLTNATHTLTRTDATQRATVRWWGKRSTSSEPEVSLRYTVQGPPWSLAACAWLAERYNGSSWDDVLSTCDDACTTLLACLAIPPRHQHHAHFVVTTFRALWEHPITPTTSTSREAPKPATSPL